MPTNVFTRIGTFDDAGLMRVLFSMEDLSSSGMMTIDPATVTGNADGEKIVKPGSIIIRGNGAVNGMGRVFPGSYATQAQSIGATTLTVKDASIFRVGDILSRGLPGAVQAVNTVQSVNATTNTLTFVAGIANAVTNGDQIWVAGITLDPDDIGMIVNGCNLATESNDVGIYRSANVYKARLPFWNSALKAALPEIKLHTTP